MASSGMFRRVGLLRTDVSEERSASFIRVTRIGEMGTLAITSNHFVEWEENWKVSVSEILKARLEIYIEKFHRCTEHSHTTLQRR
jgi:hypothetical protein